MRPTNAMYYQTDNSLVEFPILVVVVAYKLFTILPQCIINYKSF